MVVRRVQVGDEQQLMHLMQSCVADDLAFHGACSPIEWTKSWAEDVVAKRPRSVVISLGSQVVAYFDLPSKNPRIFGDETIDRHSKTFWCGAAGVRVDVVGRARAGEVFRELLFHAFSDAIDRGYEFVRAAAPWEQHPYLPMRFAEYSGLTVEPFTDENGKTKLLLEWYLPDAVRALV
jgi:hypothetical protein